MIKHNLNMTRITFCSAENDRTLICPFNTAAVNSTNYLILPIKYLITFCKKKKKSTHADVNHTSFSHVVTG